MSALPIPMPVLTQPEPQQEENTEEAPGAFDGLPREIVRAMTDQGFDRLTAVQQAVLTPDALGKDLRISSQTGSGKTVAVGLAMADVIAEAAEQRGRVSPRVLVIAPTRELAAQLGRELTWLYAPYGAFVATVTGGTNPMFERRDLSRGPWVVAGTPGRLLDHVRRGALDLSDLRALVLDEADQLLDMDFEDDLEAIVAETPEGRRTHLVSATFPPAVERLSSRWQQNPLRVEGTRLGAANTDIRHEVILGPPRQRLDVMTNLFLRHPDDKTLFFVRTRADTEGLARALAERGFTTRALHGDMSQRERTATFEAFRSGICPLLIATDVAARGLDVQDIARVVQVDLPDNPEVFTHRSGRTGRAGRAGHNVMLCAPNGKGRVNRLLRGARVKFEYGAAPTPAEILEAADERLVARVADEVRAIVGDVTPDTRAEPNGVDGVDGADVDSLTAEDEHVEKRRAPRRDPSTERRLAIAAKLLEAHDPAALVAALLATTDHAGPTQPCEIFSHTPRDRKNGRDRYEKQGRQDPRDRRDEGGREGRHVRRDTRDGAQAGYVMYQVSWGGERGADPRRLLAIVCRRGRISREEVGAIRVGPRSSTVEVIEGCADEFESAVRRKDSRDPHVRFRRWQPPGKRAPKPKRRPQG